jgi:hypothetical protein
MIVREMCWTGSGPQFGLSWGGVTWALDLSSSSPGLVRDDGRVWAKLLSLEGLVRAGRSDLDALSGRTLVGFERYRDSVRAHFAPPNWGGLAVRTMWTPAPLRDALDLEVQTSAASVGELAGVEVLVVSSYRVEGASPLLWASPRMESAGHIRSPRVWTPPGIEPGVAYVEMAHPDDLAHLMTQSATQNGSPIPCAETTRYALFGHDLERGVVLRGRVRGCWTRSQALEHEALSLYEEFLRAPLPLRT